MVIVAPKPEDVQQCYRVSILRRASVTRLASRFLLDYG